MIGVPPQKSQIRVARFAGGKPIHDVFYADCGFEIEQEGGGGMMQGRTLIGADWLEDVAECVGYGGDVNETVTRTCFGWSERFSIDV
jgi:hypothetical protein